MYGLFQYKYETNVFDGLIIYKPTIHTMDMKNMKSVYKFMTTDFFLFVPHAGVRHDYTIMLVHRQKVDININPNYKLTDNKLVIDRAINSSAI
jgi:hypothetical protein